MNTIEMLNKVHVGQKFYSKSLSATIYKSDKLGVIDEETRTTLRLNPLVLETDDWELVPQQVTDYNELFKLFDTEEGATMYSSVNEVGRWGFINKYSPKNTLIQLEDLTQGKWFKGKLTTKELREWGLT